MAYGRSLELATITGPHYYNLQRPGGFAPSRQQLARREEQARRRAKREEKLRGGWIAKLPKKLRRKELFAAYRDAKAREKAGA